MTSAQGRLTRDIIGVGASAGGLSALIDIVGGLPPGFPGCLFVVVHTSPDSPGMLPQILSRSGPLRAVHAEHDMTPQRGMIYVALPDHHLFVRRNRIQSSRGPKENGFRPAVDPLFRSLAREYGSKVMGVVLSGARDDGALGLARIKEAGGLAIVQDPAEALVSSMPLAALAATQVDYALPVRRIPEVLARAAAKPEPDRSEAGSMNPSSTDPRLPEAEITDPDRMPGEATMYTCPECGGTLWELEQPNSLAYRCHVGHRFGAGSLLSDKDAALEAALWHALRALHEQGALRRRLAARARQGRMAGLAGNYERQAVDADQRAQLIRAALIRENLNAAQPPELAPEFPVRAERDEPSTPGESS